MVGRWLLLPQFHHYSNIFRDHFAHFWWTSYGFFFEFKSTPTRLTGLERLLFIFSGLSCSTGLYWSLTTVCTKTEGPCGSGSFQCDNSSVCIPQTGMCNIELDCPNGDDEDYNKCGESCRKKIFSPSSLSLIRLVITIINHYFYKAMKLQYDCLLSCTLFLEYFFNFRSVNFPDQNCS